MKHSLLYLGGIPARPVLADRTADDLRLERAVSYFCPDVNRRREFISVLVSAPLLPDGGPDIDCSLFRAAITADFMAMPFLLSGLLERVGRMCAAKEEYARRRSTAFSVARTTESESAVLSAIAAAVVSAENARTALALLDDLAQLLHIYPPRASGLVRLAERVRSLTAQTSGQKDFDRFRGLCLDGCSCSQDAETVFALDIGADSKICRCYLSGFRRAEKDVEAKRGLFGLLSSRRASAGESSLPLDDPRGDGELNALYVAALSEYSAALSDVASAVYAEFCPLLPELRFYETALSYAGAMKAKAAPLTFPELNADGATEYAGLSDILLTLELPAGRVVQNDLDFHAEDRDGAKRGLIIRGENNSGKTVYLRSVGTAQLFAQAGLPVPAKTAKVRAVAETLTLYAASEREFCAGNDAGRFEQEVRAVSRTLDSIPRRSLVLFNEVFQTTDYGEGARGLYGVLSYLNAVGADFMAVTHLRGLSSLMLGQAEFMRTTPGYKLVSDAPGQEIS